MQNCSVELIFTVSVEQTDVDLQVVREAQPATALQPTKLTTRFRATLDVHCFSHGGARSPDFFRGQTA
jgi:hypothetical protein